MFPFKELPVRSSFLWLTWVRTARRLARRPSVPHFRKVPHSWHSAELQARVSASGQLPARPLHRSCIGKLWMYEDLWSVEEIWRNCINVWVLGLVDVFSCRVAQEGWVNSKHVELFCRLPSQLKSTQDMLAASGSCNVCPWNKTLHLVVGDCQLASGWRSKHSVRFATGCLTVAWASCCCFLWKAWSTCIYMPWSHFRGPRKCVTACHCPS